MKYKVQFNPLRIIGKYIKYIFYTITSTKVIHCIGDSHAGTFDYYRNNKIFNNTVFKIFAIGGATSTGINNINSMTKARILFDKYLKYTLKNQTLLFSLGEVDCDYVVWLRARKFKTKINSQLMIAVNRYRNYLLEIKDKGFKNIIVYSVPLPTIRKNDSKGLVSKLRKNAYININKRTDLTIKFNRMMKVFCKNEGIYFLDISKDILNKQTNLIDDKYLNPNKLDHHLYDKEIIPLITKRLINLGYK